MFIKMLKQRIKCGPCDLRPLHLTIPSFLKPAIQQHSFF